jgi:hypothetical protein
MARRYMTGFELKSGTFTAAQMEFLAATSAATGGGGYDGVVGAGAGARTGTLMYRSGSTESGLFRILETFAETELFIRWGWKLDSWKTSGRAAGDLFQIYKGTTKVLRFTSTTSGNFEIYYLDHAQQWILAATVATFADAQWHCVELHWDYKADGLLECKVDGVSILHIHDDLASGNSTSNATLIWGDNTDIHASQQWCLDDVAVNDTAGTVNNSWCGSGGIVALPLTSDADIELTPSTGSDNYALLQDDTDATDVQDSVPGQRDLYGLADLPEHHVIITATKVTLQAYSPSPMGDDVTPIYKVNGVEYEGTPVSVEGHLHWFSEIVETSPDTADPWTSDEIDDLQLGIKLQ